MRACVPSVGGFLCGRNLHGRAVLGYLVPASDAGMLSKDARSSLKCCDAVKRRKTSETETETER